MVSEKKHSQVGGRNRIMLPLPPSGLPDGWSMEQWEAYGHEYYEMNANAAQAESPQYPRFEEAAKKVKINSARTIRGLEEERNIIDNEHWIRKIYWVGILLSGFIALILIIIGLVEYQEAPMQVAVMLLIICTSPLFLIVHFYLPRKWKKKALNRSQVAWRTGGHSTAIGILKARVIKYNSDLEFASELEMILSQVETSYRYQE